MKFTAVYEKSEFGYIGYIEELPGANTQAQTLEEAKSNLIESIKLVLESNKILAEETIKDKNVIKEEIELLSA